MLSPEMSPVTMLPLVVERDTDAPETDESRISPLMVETEVLSDSRSGKVISPLVLFAVRAPGARGKSERISPLTVCTDRESYIFEGSQISV